MSQLAPLPAKLAEVLLCEFAKRYKASLQTKAADTKAFHAKKSQQLKDKLTEKVTDYQQGFVFIQQQLEGIPSELAKFLKQEVENKYKAVEQISKAGELLATFKVRTECLKADLKWISLQLEKLPDDVAASLQKEYLYKRKARNSGKGANIWLRKRTKALAEMVKHFPVPIWHINNEVRRAQMAKDEADRCQNILNSLTQFGSETVEARELLKAVKVPADQWGFSPVLPSFSNYEEKMADDVVAETILTAIASALARLIDEQWWLRKLNNAFEQYKEHCAIVIGKVRIGVSPYVSNKSLIAYRAKKKANAIWLNNMQVVNEEHDIEMTLADAVNASVSNKEVRRAELMARMRGFENMAIENGYVGEFLTVTAPSKYHSFKKNRKKKNKAYSNKNYEGASPRDTQAYLCKQWAKARAKLARKNIEMFGFRVVEPHHDGTPHWHMLLFFKPEQVELARQIICDYAVEDDQHELNIDPDQLHARAMQPTF